MNNTLRPQPRGWGEGIVQPVSEEADQLSRRLHHHEPPVLTNRGLFARENHGVKLRNCASQLALADAAYLAGLIDGEGTITLSRRHAQDRRQLVVSVVSTERRIIDWMKAALVVGKITRKRTTSDRHAPSFTYTVANRQALSVLTQVQPYLKTYKRLRADLALQSYIALTPRNGKYSTALIAARDQFEAAFLALDARSASSAFSSS